MEGIKKKIREYIVRNHPRLMNDPPRSEEACFSTVLSAGKAVEHESVREVLYQQSLKAKELIRSKGKPHENKPKDSSASKDTSAVQSGRVQKKKDKKIPSKTAATAAKAVANSKPESKPTDLLSGISKELREARKQAGNCMRCNKKGHSYKDCSNPKDSGKGKGKAVDKSKDKNVSAVESKAANVSTVVAGNMGPYQVGRILSDFEDDMDMDGGYDSEA